MSDDDYPQFGNAFPTADSSSAAQTASWNPAFRPDSQEPVDEDDDFFDRYPGATPKKHQQAPTVAAETLNAPQDEEDIARRPSISVESIIDVQSDDASPEDMDQLPSYAADAEGPATHAPQAEYDEIDEEEQVLHPDASVAEQDRELDYRIPDASESEATQDVDGAVEQVDHAAADLEGEEPRPEEHYEHQGEVTEMEAAMEPSGEAPLLEDEQPEPTTGQISRAATFGREEVDQGMGFDGSPAPSQPAAKSQPARVQLDRTFTSNFVGSAPVAETTPVEFAQSAPDDWPSFGDDQTFGELLDTENAVENAQEVPQTQASHAPTDDTVDDLLPEDEGEIPETDLAAAWGAALDDDDILEDVPTDGFDPSSAFGADDEDGFLGDELATPMQQAQLPQQTQQVQPQQRTASTNQYRPANAQAPVQQPRSIGLPTPQPFENLGRAVGTPSTGLPDFYNQLPEQAAQRPPMNQAQSFVDKAKGGYQSPYDLPMEVVKPRRRPQTQQQPSQQQVPAPPPRTSSFNAQMNRPPPSGGSGASMSPPTSSHGNAAPPPPQGIASAKTTPKTGSGFFEDLPMAQKPRARPAGQYTPGPASTGLPTPPPGPMMPPQQQSQASVAPPQRPAMTSTPSQQPQNMYGGLQQPEGMPLLPDQPSQPVQQLPAQQGPPANARYSPNSQARDLPAPAAPPANAGRYSPAPATSAAPATSRYSPAPTSEPGQKSRQSSSTGPPPGPPFRQPSHAFAPRTSSPLAGFTDKPHPPLPSEAPKPLPTSPPRVNGVQTSSFPSMESRSASMYSPQEMRAPDPQLMPPPPRPRTQSPDNTMKSQRSAASHARRPSSAGKIAHVPPTFHPAIAARGPVLPHRRQFSRDLTIVRPDNETAQDPLERWKGHPIVHFSTSGSVITSFPRQTPFYPAGQGVPSLKCTPGAIKVEDASTFLGMDDRTAKFPGPLTAKNKSRKKDLLAWMATKIEDLERATEGAMLDFNMEGELKKRVGEKLILWKIMRVYLEHNGVLEGHPKIDDEVRRILMPNLAQMGQVMELSTPASATSTTAGEPVDKHVLLQLRLALFEGQRERAVWLAEEKKLWGHAMLIASTMGPDTWKQIVAAFVRSQVKSLGSDARSMAAAYQIFAGNAEECVDELVPPSARAGFTMVAANSDDGAAAGHGRSRSKSFYERNPLEGLDSWRETLGLVASNRTPTDGPSLVALGKLLSSYGRVEAAHTCFLFARQFVKHSGPDDAEAHFVLLGANHAPTSTDLPLGGDLDTILLTEIYEYAASLSAPSNASASYLPHLQPFKLVHAQELASRGLKGKAQAYCEHITGVYTSTTRPSPYYHPTFTQAVGELQTLLSQTPGGADGKKGLFSKPAMNKVSSSASSWFSKFVAGDEDQQGPGGGAQGGEGGQQQPGPFGMVGASPPSISRPASATGMYNPMMMGGAVSGTPLQSPPLQQQQGFMPNNAAAAPAVGKYAPGATTAAMGGTKYAPAQPYSALGLPSAEPQRPGSSRYAPAPSASLGVPGAASRASSEYGAGSRRGSAQETSSQGSGYEPKLMLGGADDGSSYSYSPPILQRPELAMAGAQGGLEGVGGGLSPLVAQQTTAETSDEVDPESGGGYAPPEMQPAPPSSSGYEPPSYNTYTPYEPDPDSPVEDAKPKPKPRQIYDDDEDDAAFAARAAAALKSDNKSAADKAADDAFRKAAEADAARDAAAKQQKAGWFGGWFGGGKGGPKDPNAPAADGNKPIKAKLGEENSFYFDKELGKWVNKKASAGADGSATPAAATPPPPRGPPVSRVASGIGGPPPSGPPSRVGSGVGLPMGGGGGGVASGRPPTSGSGLGFSAPLGSSSGPPSRVGTPASVQSDAAVLGTSVGSTGAGGMMAPPPLPLNGLSAGGVGAGEGGALQPTSRPGTSLSNASSIDDLLAAGGGGGGGKKGGTVKGKKKGSQDLHDTPGPVDTENVAGLSNRRSRRFSPTALNIVGPGSRPWKQVSTSTPHPAPTTPSSVKNLPSTIRKIQPTLPLAAVRLMVDAARGECPQRRADAAHAGEHGAGLDERAVGAAVEVADCLRGGRGEEGEKGEEDEGEGGG